MTDFIKSSTQTVLYKKFPCKLNTPVTKYGLLHDIRALNNICVLQ